MLIGGVGIGFFIWDGLEFLATSSEIILGAVLRSASSAFVLRPHDRGNLRKDRDPAATGDELKEHVMAGLS